MRVKVLGSGTSTGVPVLGCKCAVCRSSDSKDFRTRASIAVSFDHVNWIVIDTSPEFRLQMLQAEICHISAVLYTHTHADHCHGFDDLRAFSFANNKIHQCYLLEPYVQEMRERFRYVWENTGYKGAKPLVELVPIPEKAFDVAGHLVEPIRLDHGAFKTCGFRFGNFAYLTDFKGFPEASVPSWKDGIDVMICSGIHFGKHDAHNTIPETIEIFRRLGVKRGIITHLSHHVSHKSDSFKMPAGVELAYDGMVIDL